MFGSPVSFSMDFKKSLISILASLAIVLHRFILLIFSPYKTMRTIGKEKDMWQILIILTSVSLYFQFANRTRGVLEPNLAGPFFFFLGFAGMIVFFYLLTRLWDKNIEIRPFIFTFTYSLLPTLLWFVSNSLLYRLLPPPRTISIAGRAFSILFVSYSVSLLLWKLILFYLAIRFSTKFHFPRILYLIFLYSALFIPYTLIMYYLKIFRVPFI